MTAYKLKKILEHIASYSNPYRKMSPFFVEYQAKECSTVNAKYNLQKKKIIIYNFSRPVTNILCSAIHELAHHVCVEVANNTTHDIEFYRTFKELLSAAVEIGYLDYEKCRKIDDTNTVKMMEKKAGRVTAYYQEKNDPNKDYGTIQIIGGYSVREYLTGEKFHYSPMERIWEKDLPLTECVKYKKEIQKLDPQTNVIISAVNDLSIQVYYTFTVKGQTYQHKENLSKHGYRYKEGLWQKKFEAANFQEEYLFLKSLRGIEYKIS